MIVLLQPMCQVWQTYDLNSKLTAYSSRCVERKYCVDNQWLSYTTTSLKQNCQTVTCRNSELSCLFELSYFVLLLLVCIQYFKIQGPSPPSMIHPGSDAADKTAHTIEHSSLPCRAATGWKASIARHHRYTQTRGPEAVQCRTGGIEQFSLHFSFSLHFNLYTAHF